MLYKTASAGIFFESPNYKILDLHQIGCETLLEKFRFESDKPFMDRVQIRSPGIHLLFRMKLWQIHREPTAQ